MPSQDDVFNALVDDGHLDSFLDLIDPKGFDEFSRSVLLKLRESVNSLEVNADKYYNQSEEQLSTTIALLLESAGFKTKNEPSARGHIDIYVEKDGFKWLIEAKIGYNNTKIFEGLLQLCSRYLTNQRSACLLLYFKKRNIKEDFQSWKDYLTNKTWLSYASTKGIAEDCELCLSGTNIKSDQYCFGYGFISAVNSTAGEPIDIYHIGANLHYKPFDTSGREGEQLRKEQAKILLEHFYHSRDTNTLQDLTAVYKAIDDLFDIEKLARKAQEAKDKLKKRAVKTPKSKPAK